MGSRRAGRAREAHGVRPVGARGRRDRSRRAGAAGGADSVALPGAGLCDVLARCADGAILADRVHQREAAGYSISVGATRGARETDQLAGGRHAGLGVLVARACEAGRARRARGRRAWARLPHARGASRAIGADGVVGAYAAPCQKLVVQAGSARGTLDVTGGGARRCLIVSRWTRSGAGGAHRIILQATISTVICPVAADLARCAKIILEARAQDCQELIGRTKPGTGCALGVGIVATRPCIVHPKLTYRTGGAEPVHDAITSAYVILASGAGGALGADPICG